jgi:hypothetical protein
VSQYISQYPRPNWGVKLSVDLSDMSLVSDERNYNEEVVFSPYLIAQTYGNRLPFYFDTNDTERNTPLTVYWNKYTNEAEWANENLDHEELETTRTPGRAQQMHEKLSFMNRKVSPNERRKKHEEKQARAQEKREKFYQDRLNKLKELTKKIQEVNELKKKLLKAKKMTIKAKMQRA